jgi:mono/diheme cytochrome c family protein
LPRSSNNWTRTTAIGHKIKVWTGVRDIQRIAALLTGLIAFAREWEVVEVRVTRVLPVVVILALAAALGQSPLQAQTSSGDYTPAQAAAGAKLYATHCSACHGANLRGVNAPALIGNAFTSQFTGEPVADMYGLMSKNMPLTAPGSLKPAEYLALTAYILQQNKFPAGSSPLTQAKLKTIKIVSP